MAREKKQAGKASTEPEGKSLLDQILDQTKPADDGQRGRNKQFIEAVVRSALESGQSVGGDVERTIKAWQAQIDQKLSHQLNAIMHHEEFQKLEGTWRGLDYLVKQSETGVSLKIKVMNVSKKH